MSLRCYFLCHAAELKMIKLNDCALVLTIYSYTNISLSVVALISVVNQISPEYLLLRSHNVHLSVDIIQILQLYNAFLIVFYLKSHGTNFNGCILLWKFYSRATIFIVHSIHNEYRFWKFYCQATVFIIHDSHNE